MSTEILGSEGSLGPQAMSWGHSETPPRMEGALMPDPCPPHPKAPAWVTTGLGPCRKAPAQVVSYAFAGYY